MPGMATQRNGKWPRTAASLALAFASVIVDWRRGAFLASPAAGAVATLIFSATTFFLFNCRVETPMGEAHAGGTTREARCAVGKCSMLSAAARDSLSPRQPLIQRTTAAP